MIHVPVEAGKSIKSVMGLELMEFGIFKKFNRLRYGLSEKEDGFMNVRPSGNQEYDLAAKENRQRFFKRHNIDGKIFIPRLVHSGNVMVVNEENYKERLKADGFVTDLSNLFLVITVADCFPMYFYDPIKQVIGIAHGGWKGIVKNITKNVISNFVESFHSNPQDILLTIGPGLQKCHFTVGDDVIDRFKNCKEFIESKGDKYAVDLVGIITNQARQEGITSIETSNDCTYCSADKYFSYRREKTSPLQVMLAYIGLLKND